MFDIIENSQYWGDNPKLFAAISTGATPEERMLLCMRWFISTLHSSYSSRSTAAGMEKKPYNPILGEQYFAQWDGDKEIGTTVLNAEQVSHHPPIMAFHLENKKAGVALEGHTGQKTRFAMPAGIDVSQTGHVIVKLEKFNERYLVTLPTLNVRGIVTGRPWVELAGTSYIIGTSGFLTTIEFSTKGYFSGERHSFKANIKPIDGGNTVYYAQGTWGGLSNYSTDKKGNGDSKVLFDVNETERIPPTIKSVSEMGHLESHKLWAAVTKAIVDKDYAAASRLKSQIEDKQRTLAKERTERGETQADALKIFTLVEEDSDETGKAYQDLRAKLIEAAGPKALKEDDTKPHWRLRV
ncbi:glycerol ethanol, ferric requiring protein [Dissophora globulifera]|uniref:Glycerol ethanol, ferric requiring protein n=1 Tax=Dissophora globulifera TaxID=979702 RepID=A0A9P6REH3_9FUNG|nr:glycerol ethanol, ferric requiring protein [Dissophora globulifera]